jgi:predicted  nucleic acid-binding Zn-ribbon protein
MMLDASPHWNTHTAMPYAAWEIDTHPDCTRIWATIEQTKQEALDDIQAEKDAVSQELSDLEDAVSDAKEDTSSILESMDGLCLRLEHGDDGLPFAISHSLVRYSDDPEDTDNQFIDLLEEKLAELTQHILDEHFGEDE